MAKKMLDSVIQAMRNGSYTDFASRGADWFAMVLVDRGSLLHVSRLLCSTEGRVVVVVSC